MADFYIDPDTAVSGVGSEADPFKAWSDVTWGAGNTYLQKRGTTETTGIIIGTSGTSGNLITIGTYGESIEKAYLAPVANNGIIGNGKEYITISDFNITAPASKNGISFLTTSTKSATGVRISDCITHDCGNNGISVGELPNYSPYQPMTDVIVDNCISYNNGAHGVSMTGALTSGSIIRNCTAYNNGSVSTAWGIYMRGRGLKYVGTAWSLVAGTVYEVNAVTETTMRENEVCVTVAAPGRTNGGSTNPVFLTEGVYGSLAANEWAHNTTTDMVQINIGESPSNKSVIFSTADTTGGTIEDCTAYNHLFNDGVGIGFDHIVTNGIIRRCTSYNNTGPGFSANVNRGCDIIGCVSFGNEKGIQIASMPIDTIYATVTSNNVLHDNLIGIDVLRGPTAQSYNNIITSNVTNFGIDSESVGIDYKNNCHFGNTITQNIDVTDITSDPLFISSTNYNLQSSSPCVGTGIQWWGTDPRPDTLGEPLPDRDIDIGAYQSTHSLLHPKNI